jgi:hypothetical protein
MKMKMALRNPLFALAGLGLLFMPIVAQASPASSVTSTMASVPLSYNGPETLNLNATVSTGTVAFPLGGGPAPSVISVTTTYNLNPGRVVTIEAGFNDFMALTDGTGDSIPAFAISAQFSGGGGQVTSWPNCGMFEGSGQTQIQFMNSCGWITFPALTPGHTSGTHTHTITLSLQPQFASAPGNYTGTLLISAQAN